MGVLVVLVVIYEVGALLSLPVYAVRAGGSLVGPYITAVMHPASRRNGIPWLLKTLGKAIAWPYVLWDWNERGRPPSPVLYGEAAAEKLGIDPDRAEGFMTRWMAPPEDRPPRRTRPPRTGPAAGGRTRPSGSGRVPPTGSGGTARGPGVEPARRGGEGRRLPPDILRMMERFGRHEINVMESTDDGYEVFQDTQQPLWTFASEDPGGFVRMMADACITAGGWAVYGAERTVLNLVSPTPTSDDWHRLLDASLGFLRANYVPPLRIPPYAWDRFVASGGTARTWVPLREPPAREAATITPFIDGKTRLLMRLGQAQDANRVLARKEGDEYVAFIDARQSDEDPTRTQWEYKRAHSPYDLYLEVGWSTQI